MSLTLLCNKRLKVTVCGGASGVGQPLSLLLKQSLIIQELAIYDVVPFTPGVVDDLSQINTNSNVSSHVGQNSLKDAVAGSDIIIITSGVTKKPGMTRNDLIKTNLTTVCDIIKVIGQINPNAFIGILSNPMISIVPAAAEILKKLNVYDSKKLFGITTLDVMRSNRFIAEQRCLNATEVNVPVVGGYCCSTMVPLISQCKPKVSLDYDIILKLTKRIQEFGSEILNASSGTGTLAMGYAGAKFTNSLCKAILGEQNVVECSFVESSEADTPFFSSPVLIGKNGLEKNYCTGHLSDLENEFLQAALPELASDIQKGIDFGKNYKL